MRIHELRQETLGELLDAAGRGALRRPADPRFAPPPGARAEALHRHLLDGGALGMLIAWEIGPGQAASIPSRAIGEGAGGAGVAGVDRGAPPRHRLLLDGGEAIEAIATRLPRTSGAEALRALPVSLLVVRAFDAGVESETDYARRVAPVLAELPREGALDAEVLLPIRLREAWSAAETAAGRGFDACMHALRRHLAPRRTGRSPEAFLALGLRAMAALARGGRPLDAAALLEGGARALARSLVAAFDAETRSLCRVAELLDELDLHVAVEQAPDAAVVVLLALRLAGRLWLAAHPLEGAPRATYLRELDGAYARHADRFLVLSRWAGAFTEPAAEAAALAAIAADGEAIARAPEQAEVLARVEARLAGPDGLVPSLVRGGLAHLEQLAQPGDAGDMDRYFLPLWVWHRLEENRARCSRLHVPSRRRAEVRVDALLPAAVYRAHMEVAAPEADADYTALGTALLVEKNFPLGDGRKTLLELLPEIEEIAAGNVLSDELRKALLLTDELLDPRYYPPAQVREAIRARTRRMLDDLRDYVRGDEGAPGGLRLDGAWTTESHYITNPPVTYLVRFTQQGRRVTATYEAGALEGALSNRRLEGEWSQAGVRGRFVFHFDEAGASFTGSWGSGPSSTDGGAWNGRRRRPAVIGRPRGV